MGAEQLRTDFSARIRIPDLESLQSSAAQLTPGLGPRVRLLIPQEEKTAKDHRLRRRADWMMQKVMRDRSARARIGQRIRAPAPARLHYVSAWHRARLKSLFDDDARASRAAPDRRSIRSVTDSRRRSTAVLADLHRVFAACFQSPAASSAENAIHRQAGRQAEREHIYTRIGDEGRAEATSGKS